MAALSDWLTIQKSPEYWEKYNPQERATIKAAWFSENIAPTEDYQSRPDEEKVAILRGFSKYGDDVSPERTFWGTLGDIGISAAKGIVGLGEAAVGIADLPTFGLAGKALEGIGYDPEKTKQLFDEGLSAAQVSANEKVDRAEGFWDTTKAMVQNPSTILHAGVESAPSMLGGGAVARGLITKGVPKLIAAAAGEAAVTTGQSAEQMRSQSPTGLMTPEMMVAAPMAGAITGAISLAGLRLAKRFKFADPEALFAGIAQKVGDGAAKKPAEVTARILGGMTSETFQELTQSGQEQVWMNAATGKPLMEGVGESMAEGGLVGGAMGAGANLISRPQDKVQDVKDQPTFDGKVQVAQEQAAQDTAPTPLQKIKDNAANRLESPDIKVLPPGQKLMDPMSPNIETVQFPQQTKADRDAIAAEFEASNRAAAERAKQQQSQSGMQTILQRVAENRRKNQEKLDAVDRVGQAQQERQKAIEAADRDERMAAEVEKVKQSFTGKKPPQLQNIADAVVEEAPGAARVEPEIDQAPVEPPPVDRQKQQQEVELLADILANSDDKASRQAIASEIKKRVAPQVSPAVATPAAPPRQTAQQPSPVEVAPPNPAGEGTPKTEPQRDITKISESAIVAFPDMMESEGGLLSLNKFTPEEQQSLRNAGIVETATTSNGNTYEGVNSEYLWQRRKQIQDGMSKGKGVEPIPKADLPRAEAVTEPSEMAAPAKAPWEMTYQELRSAVSPSTRDELANSRGVLASVYPEQLGSAQDPWGIKRAVERGDELPRTPVSDLSIRHKRIIKKALDDGKAVPQETLDEYPDLQGKPSPPTLTEPIGKESPVQQPAPVQEKRTTPKPKKESQGPQTLRGRIKQMGGINFLRFKGEAKNMPTPVKFLTKKTGMPIDTLEENLKAEGWLMPEESLLDLLRDPNVLKRGMVAGSGGDSKTAFQREQDRKLEESSTYEPEEPPPGNYVEMMAGDLPEGKKLTIIDGNGKDGWDEYEVIESDPFSVTLQDGTIIEMASTDKVQVRVEDLPKGEQAAARDEAEERPQASFDEMVQEAQRWKGAAVKADRAHGKNTMARLKHSRMTTKGDLDKYLMDRFGVDAATARNVSNELTAKNLPADESAEISDFTGQPWADAVKVDTTKAKQQDLIEEEPQLFDEPQTNKARPVKREKSQSDQEQKDLFGYNQTDMFGVNQGRKLSTKKEPGSITTENQPDKPEGVEKWRDTSKWDVVDSAQPEGDTSWLGDALPNTKLGKKIDLIRNYEPPVKPTRFMRQQNIDEISSALLALKEGKLNSGNVSDIIKKNIPIPDEVGSGERGDNSYPVNIRDELPHLFAPYFRDYASQGAELAMPGFDKEGVRVTAKNIDAFYYIGAPSLDGKLYEEIIDRFRDNPSKILIELHDIIASRVDEDDAAIELMNKALEQASDETYKNSPEYKRSTFKLLPSPTSKPGKVDTELSSATTAPESSITPRQVQKAFEQKGFKTERLGNLIRVKTPSGNLYVDVTDMVVENDAEAIKIGYGRSATPGEKVAGSYQNFEGTGTIRLKRNLADEYTLSHETFHHLKAAGIFNPMEIATLKKAAGPDEEAQARWLKEAKARWIEDGLGRPGEEAPAQWIKKERDSWLEELQARWIEGRLRKRGEQKGIIARLVQKVADWLDAFANLVAVTERGIVRKMESGEFLGRESYLGEDVTEESRLESSQAEFSSRPQTQSEAFKRWFKNSVVTKDGKAGGEPLVVYRGEGSGDNFDEFDRKKTNENAFFFTDDVSIASVYSKSKTPRAFFLKSENMMNSHTREGERFIREWAKAWDDDGWVDRETGEEVDPYDAVMSGRLFDFEGDWSGRRWKDLQASVEDAGYDGAVLPDYDNDSGVFNAYIVFDPNQIKSATGNNGDFSPTNPDIRYSTLTPKEQGGHKANLSAKYDEAKAAIERPLNDFMYWIVDKNHTIQAVQSKLDQVTEDIDLFLKETQRPKVTASRVKGFWDEQVKPFMIAIAKSGKTLKAFEEYAHAKHAPEANIDARDKNAKRYLDQLIEALPAKLTRSLRAEMAELTEKKRKAAKIKGVFGGIGLTPEDNYNFLQKAFTDFAAEKETQAYLKKWESFTGMDETKDGIGKLSGMSNAEAKAITAKADPEMEPLRKMLSDINANRIELLYDAGLIPQEEYEAIQNKFKFYVPLHREGYGDSLFGASKGLNPTGKPIKTRGGSKRAVVDIVGNSIASYEKAINLAEKARSTRTLRDLVKANPEPELWTLKKEKKSPRLDQYGNVRMYPDLFNIADNEFRFMADQEQYILEVDRDNKDMMLLIRNLKAADSQHGPILSALSKANQWLARINTTWAPEFVISNFARDIQTAGINIQDTGVKGKSMLSGAGKAIKAIWRVEKGKTKGDPLEALYGRFKDAGGKISWSDVHGSVEKLGKKISKEIEMLQGKRPSFKAFRSFVDTVEAANTSIENGIRLHVFKLATEQGFSDSKAAQIASDITVDFTKKGAAGPIINSLYLFANAGIQGSYRIIRAASKSSAVRKSLAGVVGAGFTFGMANILMGGADDDGEDYYSKIEEHVKERNAIFMIPGTKGKYAKIPLPWGYNLFWNIGNEAAAAIATKNYKPLQGAARLASTFANAFNPLQSGTLLQTLAPTIADPFAMVDENKNWFGGPLMPEKNVFDRTPNPDSERYWKSARKPSVWVASILNRMTGGDKIKKGAIDVSPETLDLVIDTAGGSMLRFFTDIGAVASRSVGGEEIELQRVPFVRRVFGEKSEWADRTKYFRNLEDVLTVKEQLAAYEGTKYHRYISMSTRPEQAVIGNAKRTEYALKRLKKDRKAAEAQGDKARVKEIDAKIKRHYIEFNKKYNAEKSRY